MHSPDENIPIHEFACERSLSSSLTFACNVYSIVPYIGIIFIPFATVFGGRDYLAARRGGDQKRTRSALRILAVSLLLIVFQGFLWSLLYIVPTLTI